VEARRRPLRLVEGRDREVDRLGLVVDLHQERGSAPAAEAAVAEAGDLNDRTLSAPRRGSERVTATLSFPTAIKGPALPSSASHARSHEACCQQASYALARSTGPSIANISEKVADFCSEMKNWIRTMILSIRGES
jgi:hypothetical protein